jgi:hypothetical protein
MVITGGCCRRRRTSPVFSLHPRLGQLILQLESRFISIMSQAEGPADRLFLLSGSYFQNIIQREGGQYGGRRNWEFEVFQRIEGNVVNRSDEEAGVRNQLPIKGLGDQRFATIMNHLHNNLPARFFIPHLHQKGIGIFQIFLYHLEGIGRPGLP